MNVIMRVAWNRPEMLQVSIEHEIKAREYHMIKGDFITIFVIDHNPSRDVIEAINKYLYEKRALVREKPYGLTRNILLGINTAFEFADDYIIYIEDDICVHRTYFKYIDEVMKMDVGKYGVISAYNRTDGGSVNDIYKGHHYCAWGACITRNFFERYIKEHINGEYFGLSPNEMDNYRCRDKYLKALNEKYKEHWGHHGYKYKDGMHNEQAGLINRLVDIAMIEEEMYVIMPSINRQQHIGFYGKNRPGATIPGKSFDERVVNLREIVKSSDKLYEMTGSKQYKDYKTFSPKLNEWDGSLRLI